MARNIKDCFSDDPFFYYFQYESFFVSAMHLENIAIESGKIWEQELKKLNPNGALEKITPTQELHEAESNMRGLGSNGTANRLKDYLGL